MTKQRTINYRIYEHGNEVIAISTYAKRPVRGVAKCSPHDTFDAELGKKLAIARCNRKVAEKRANRAEEKYKAAVRALREAREAVDRAAQYYNDAKEAWVAADDEVYELEGSM